MAAVKGIVIFMGLIIVTLMGLIVYGFYQKAQNPDFKFFSNGEPKVVSSAPQSGTTALASTSPPTGQPASFGEVSLDLAPSAQVVSAQASDNRLVLVIARDGQTADLVAVIDINSGKVLGRVKTSR